MPPTTIYQEAVVPSMTGESYIRQPIKRAKFAMKSSDDQIVPVLASKPPSRRGFNVKLEELDAAAIKWNANIEEINIPEHVEWLINNDHGDELSELDTEILTSWIRRDVKELTLDNESKFCDVNILNKLHETKFDFDNLGAEDIRLARIKSNPFESIRGNIFKNRDSVKMANIDSMLDYMFTEPKDENGKSLIKKDDLLYFGEICPGIGGFNEYLLWRKKWLAKGFGFASKSDNDFFDGNPVSINALTKLVLNETKSGVYVMMADGGFTIKGLENIQELVSKQLYLAQCLFALSIVRTKGHFVVKLLDIFTPFSVSLIYLMYKCFQQICICKPNTSRPENSERYLVCKWKKPNTETIRRHLFGINMELWHNKNSALKVVQIVPLSVMQEDKQFYDYICYTNNTLAKKQIVGLLKILAFCHDKELMEKRQFEMRKKSIRLWKLPDQLKRESIRNQLSHLLQVCLGHSG